MTKTKRVGNRSRKVQVQTCTGKLVSGTVKFQTAAGTASATLARAGRTYATGRISLGSRTSLAELAPLRTLTRGRDVLTVKRGGLVLERQIVTLS